VTSLGYNLCSDSGDGVLRPPGDQINTNPKLGPLQDNRGPTFTHALLAGSPAVNACNRSFTPRPEYDQRGLGYRPVVNGRVDIGAFEVQQLSSFVGFIFRTATRTLQFDRCPQLFSRAHGCARPHMSRRMRANHGPNPKGCKKDEA
jgi:hypothetical protein